MSDTVLKGDHHSLIPAKFGLFWLSGFRENLNVKNVVKPVYKGHSGEPENVSFYIQVKIICTIQ